MLQGEVEYFVKNFQDKRGDREIENIFAVLERVSELRWETIFKPLRILDSC